MNINISENIWEGSGKRSEGEKRGNGEGSSTDGGKKPFIKLRETILKR